MAGFLSPTVVIGSEFYWWEGQPVGYWDDPLSWIPLGVPGSEASVFIYSQYGAQVAPIYRSAASPTLGAFVLDTLVGGGSVHFWHPADRLVSLDATVGSSGAAAYTQTGGEARFDVLLLGDLAGSLGVYELQGSGHLVCLESRIGGAGRGDFTLDGEAGHHSDAVMVSPGSIYRLKAGKFDGTSFALNGGAFSQTGGEATLAGFDNKAGSSCSIAGGVLHVATFAQFGAFDQSGGTFRCGAPFKNALNASFAQSGGVWSAPQVVNEAMSMTISGQADFRAGVLANARRLQLAGGVIRGLEVSPGVFGVCQASNSSVFQMIGGRFVGEFANSGAFQYAAGDFTGGKLTNSGAFTRSAPFACARFVNLAACAADSTNPISADGTGLANPIENNGTLTIAGHALAVTGVKPVVNRGTLSGTGSIIANLLNEASLVITTNDGAVLAVSGDYTQTAPASLTLTIAPSTGGATCGRLTAGGAASLAGELQLTAAGYTPVDGDRFVVVSSAHRRGEFQVWTLPGLSPGLVWLCERMSGGLALRVGSPVRADLDADGDVDAADLTVQASCFAGPAVPRPATPVCAQADLDGDNDVDQEDFGLLQRCYHGPGVPADPACEG